MLPDEIDALRRRLIIGGAAIVSIVYLILLHNKIEAPSSGYLLGVFVTWLLLFVLWLAY